MTDRNRNGPFMLEALSLVHEDGTRPRGEEPLFRLSRDVGGRRPISVTVKEVVGRSDREGKFVVDGIRGKVSYVEGENGTHTVKVPWGSYCAAGKPISFYVKDSRVYRRKPGE